MLGAPSDEDDEGYMIKILTEMGFFLSLLLSSEVIRWTMKQRTPQSPAVNQALWICTLVLSWYTVSITLILFNKWIISSWHGTGMTFPIFYTSTHMLLKGVFATLYYVCWGERTLPRIDTKTFTGLSIAGACAALDIVCSNVSLVHISATYYTFLKSSALIFYLVFAVLFRIEQCSVSISSTVLLVSLGMFLTSYGETDFSAVGFSLVIASEMFAAIRWIVTQITVKDSGVDAMTAVLYMAPASTLTLLPAVFAIERYEVVTAFTEMGDFVNFMALVCFPGFLALLLLLVEVQLVKETSGLTLTVFGNLKSVCTVIFAILVFGEQTTALQWIGLAVAVVGMIAYSHAKEASDSLQQENGAEEQVAAPQKKEDESSSKPSYSTFKTTSRA